MSDGFLCVTREDCSEDAWRLLRSRAEEIQQLRQQLVAAYKRLCVYEGHIPIMDPEGRVWCELCEEEIG